MVKNKAYLEIEKLNNEKLQSIKELKYMFRLRAMMLHHNKDLIQTDEVFLFSADTMQNAN